VFGRSLDSQQSPVISAHQSKWQQEILRLYGSDVCLIDATYKTTVYDMPLFFLCVFTNVGYVNAATFLLGMDGYPIQLSKSGRISTIQSNPAPAGSVYSQKASRQRAYAT